MPCRSLAAVVAALVLLALPVTVSAQPFVWNVDGNATWDAMTPNWLLNGSPASYTNAATSAVVFGDAITANRAVAVAGGGVTVGAITFDAGPFAYTVGTGGNTILLDNGPDAATITVGRGSGGTAVYAGAGGHTITGSPLVFTRDLAVVNDATFGLTGLTISSAINRATAGGQVVVSGVGNTAITGAIGGTVTGGLVKNGAGTLNLSNPANAFGGGVTVNGGVLALWSNTDTALGTGGVVINPGATLRFAGTNSITLSAGRTLTVNGTAAQPSGIDLGFSVTARLTTANRLLGTGVAMVTASNTSGGRGALSVEAAQPGFTGVIQVGAPGVQQVGSVLLPPPTTGTQATELQLASAGTLPNVAGVVVNAGATLIVTQPAAALVGRLGTAPLTVNGGGFQYSPATTSPAADAFGAVTVNGLWTVLGGAQAGAAAGTTLTFGPLALPDHATLALRSAPTIGNGSVGGGANAGVNYKFANLTDLGGSGTSRNVLPWAAATGGVSSTTANNLVTYDGNGLRQLTAAEVATSATALTPGVNCNLTGTATNPGTVTINALLNASGTASLTGTGVVTVASGAVVNFNTLTVNGPTLLFPAGGYFHLGRAVTLIGTTTVGGAGGLTLSGPRGGGTPYQMRMTTTAPNAFTGGLTLNGNTQLLFARNDQLGTDAAGRPAGAVALGGGQLIYTGAGDAALADAGVARPITVTAAGGTLGNDIGGTTLRVPGTISGPGQLTIATSTTSSNSGVVELTNAGANTYTGGTIIAYGSLRVSNANQLGSGPFLLNGGTLAAAGPLLFAAGATVAGAATINTGAYDVTFAGLNGTGGTTGSSATSGLITKTGSGTVTVTDDGTFAGAVRVSVGGLTLSGNGRLAAIRSLDIINGSLTLDNSGTALSRRLAGTGVTLWNYSRLDAIGGATPVAESLGPLTLSGYGFSTINVTGPSGVVLRFSSLVSNGGTVRFAGDGLGTTARIVFTALTTNQFLDGQSVRSSTTETDAYYDASLSGGVPVGVRLVNPATDYLNGPALQNAAPTDTPTTARFRVSAAVANPVPVFGAANTVNRLQLAPGGTLDFGTTGGTLTLTSGQVVAEAGAASQIVGTGMLTAGGSLLTVTANGDLTVAAGVAAAGLGKYGPGTLTLSGPVAISGGTALAAGTVRAVGAAVDANGFLSLPAAQDVSFSDGDLVTPVRLTGAGGGTVYVSNAGPTGTTPVVYDTALAKFYLSVGEYAHATTLSGTVGDHMFVSGYGYAATISARIDGGAAGARLVFTGTNNTSGTARLTNAANGFTGTVVVAAGTLAVTAGGALGVPANTLELAVGDPTAGGFRFDADGVVIPNSVAVTAATAVNTNGYRATLAGPVSGPAALHKTGSGRLSLNGAVAAPVVVAGGTLGGTGTLTAGVTVGAATLAPGDGVGTLTARSAVTLAATSVARFELNGAGAGEHSVLALGDTGSVALNGATLQLAVTGAADPAFTAATTLDLVRGTGANQIAGTFGNAAGSGSTVVVTNPLGPDYSATITYSPTAVTLSNFAPVPEPAGVLFLGVAAVGVWRWRRGR